MNIKIKFFLFILFLINYFTFISNYELIVIILLFILLIFGFFYMLINSKLLFYYIFLITPSLGYLNEYYRFSFSTYGGGILFGILGIYLIICSLINHLNSFINKNNFLLIAYFTWSLLISIFNALDIFTSINSIVRLFTWITISVLSYDLIKNEKDIIYFFKILSYSLIIPILFFLINYIKGNYEYIPYFFGQYAIANAYGSTNQLSIFSFMILSLFSYFYFRSLINDYIFLGILFIVILILSISLSRTALICAFILLLSWTIILGKRKLIIYLSIVAIVLLLLYGQNLIFRILLGFNLYDNKNSLVGRIDLWYIGLKFVGKDILWGKGTGVEKTEIFRRITGDQPVHNGLISSILETGIIGSIILFFYFFSSLFFLIRNIVFINNNHKLFYQVILISEIIFFITFFTENTYYSFHLMLLFIAISTIGRKLKLE